MEKIITVNADAKILHPAMGKIRKLVYLCDIYMYRLNGSTILKYIAAGYEAPMSGGLSSAYAYGMPDKHWFIRSDQGVLGHGGIWFMTDVENADDIAIRIFDELLQNKEKEAKAKLRLSEIKMSEFREKYAGLLEDKS